MHATIPTPARLPDPASGTVLTHRNDPAAHHQRSTLEQTTSSQRLSEMDRITRAVALAAPPEAVPQKLLRKEVIQPHLPVRLPCYDLVLITDPTFDGSLHKGWATGFGCYRLS